LKVQLGEQVQAGQTLLLLAQHQQLFVEGAAFARELPLLERAVREGWPVQLETPGAANDWPAAPPLRIAYLANRAAEDSQTIPFYVPLANQYREQLAPGRTHRLWRYRPGQRVRLAVPVEQLAEVFVVPLEAVTREGAEAYVFRANGDAFDRKPVHVVYQDRRVAVVANDRSVSPGVHVATTGAAQLNRMAKSKSSALPPGFHVHADGSVHMGSH
jgi:cobalt-zinc-cadmium efflux system membrane fusion protein